MKAALLPSKQILVDTGAGNLTLGPDHPKYANILQQIVWRQARRFEAERLEDGGILVDTGGTLVKLGRETPGYRELVEELAAPIQYEAHHAPHTMTIQGKEYRGGEFIPDTVMASATPEEKAAILAPKLKKKGPERVEANGTTWQKRRNKWHDEKDILGHIISDQGMQKWRAQGLVKEIADEHLEPKRGGSNSSGLPGGGLANKTVQPPQGILPAAGAGVGGAGGLSKLPDNANKPGAGTVPPDDGTGNRSASGVGTGAGGTPAGATGRGRSERVEKPVAKPDDPTDAVGANFHYDTRDFFEHGLKAKFRANVEAIKTLQTIKAEGRTSATLDEQKKLSKYVGWGQFPRLFKWDAQDWKKERDELQGLLSEEEFSAARGSTLNAHYTDPSIIDAHWKMADKLGYKGGRFLETSAGIGYYLGMMPSELAGKTKSSAVELDQVSGQILKLLYPKANVQVQGFEAHQAPDNFYDLVASNVPFGAYKVHDLRYNKFQANIHDYFFLKSADLAKPGGLVMHLTSTGTMDKPDSKIRQELAKTCDLVSAVRFPGNTHKEGAGTEVVTDMLILRKRAPGEAPVDPNVTPPEAQPKQSGFSGTTTDSLGRLYHWENGKRVPGPNWLETTTVPDPAGGEPIEVNKYFADHPEQILGTLDRTGTMYGANQKNVTRTDDYEKRLAAAIDRLPSNIMRSNLPNQKSFTPESLPAPNDVKDGGFSIQDGKLFVRHGGGLVKQKATKEQIAIIQAHLGLVGAMRAVINAETRGEDATAAWANLNKVYDAFVAEHGYLNDRANKKAFGDDPDAPNLLALEKFNRETKKATKADIFSKDTIRSVPKVTHAGSAAEALAVSLHETGGVSMDRLVELTGQDKHAIGKELVEKGLAYKDPSEGWKSGAIYLSGNVRRKLAMAKAAAATDPLFEGNVSALEKVQPADIEHTEIDVKLGAPWVPPSDVTDFASNLVSGSPEHFQITYVPQTGNWHAAYTNRGKTYLQNTQPVRELWSTPRASFMELLNAGLNGTTVTVTDKVEGPDGPRSVVNTEETDAANAKVAEIKDKFKEWLWTDDDRRERLHRFYNDNYNNTVKTVYDGSHQTFPGMNPAYDMGKHRRDFIWQVVTTGKGLMAHEVGTGKTFGMIAGAMELRRLGLAKKPAIACLKANIDAITDDARKLYPGANILSTAGAFTAEKRQQVMARIATGDYDMVILTHDQLNKMKMKPETNARYIQEELDNLEAAITASKEEDPSKSNYTVKQLEKSKKSLEAKLKGALNEKAKDDTLYFEDSGIDHLFVDECFPGWTVIQTDRGPLTIGEVVEKRLPVKLLSCNRATKKLEWKPITAWFKRPLRNHLVKVIHEHGSFVCTPNHNIWTEENGYVQAGLLTSNHTVRVVQRGFCNDVPSTEVLQQGMLRQSEVASNHKDVPSLQTAVHKACVGRQAQNQLLLDSVRQQISLQACNEEMSSLRSRIHATADEGRRAHPLLLKGMRKEMVLVRSGMEGEVVQEDSGSHYGRNAPSVVRADEVEQSDVQARDTRENEAGVAWQDILSAGRKWDDYRTAAITGVRPLLANRTSDQYRSGEEQIPIAAQELQGGHRQSDIEDCRGSGWADAPITEMEVPGQAEDGSLIRARVVRVALYQRAGDERTIAGGEGSVDVYDVEVADNHNYFADGVNVSNSHQFKNLPVYSKMGRVKGVPATASQRASNMLMRGRWLMEQNGGRGFVFATGTPVTNTLAELYNNQRYLQPELLKERGLNTFDAWANVFGDIQNKMEFTVSGEYKPVARFSKFTNLPELKQMIGQDIDVQRAEDLKKPDGSPWIVRPFKHEEKIVAPKTEAMTRLMTSLQDRAQAIKGKPVVKGGDNMLVICTDGRKGAIDMRLLDPEAKDDPQSKTNLAVQKVLQIHKERPGMTQLIFSDVGVHPAKEKAVKAVGGEDDLGEPLVDETGAADMDAAGAAGNANFHLYGDIINKLVAGGIPRDQIADFSTLEGEKKEAAAEGLRQGKILVGIGSTQKMGTGINVQDKLTALHHLDVPWLPASIEQRDGRGWRQGNINKDLDVYRYVSEGSLDQTFWQIVGNKQKFIQQVMASKKSQLPRTMVDQDSEELTPDQLMAAASGDPRVIEKVDLDEEIRNLYAAQKRHSAEQTRFKDAIRKGETKILDLESKAKAFRQAKQHLDKHPADEFKINLAGKDYTERPAAMEALKAELDKPVENIWSDKKLGTFRGLEVFQRGAGTFIRDPEGNDFPTGPSLQSIEYVTRNIGKRVEEADKDVAKAKADLETVRSNIGKPFPKTAELETKRARSKAIENELRKERGGEVDEETGKPARPETPAWQIPQSDYKIKAFLHNKGYASTKDIPENLREEMNDEYKRTVSKYVGEHKKAVQEAHMQGEPIPANVLKDYPDLAPPPEEEKSDELFAPTVETPEPEAKPMVKGADGVWYDPDDVAEHHSRAGQQSRYDMSTWDEQKHPRGQPENAGEFGPGGFHGGSTANAPAKSSDELGPNRKPQEKQAAQGQQPQHAQEPKQSPEEAAADYQRNGVNAKAFLNWFGNWNDPQARSQGLVSKVIDYLTGKPKATVAVEPSKVTDEHGQPKTVYHGTSADFESFDPSKANPNAIFGGGFYFSEDESVAKEYSSGNAMRGANTGGQPRMVKAFLNIKKPFDGDWHASNLVKNPGMAKFSYEFISSALGGNRAATDKLRAMGYDGITHEGTKSDGKKFRVWIAFRPEQVKSLNNRGSFDPNDPRMDYAKESASDLERRIATAAAQCDTDPSEAEKKSGLYKMGHVTVQGLPITIETPAGATRSGVGADGKPWSVKLLNHYGYIKRTEGADQQHFDCFLGPNPSSELVFIIDQVNEEGRFDESKGMIGWDNEKEAKQAYLDNYSPGWKGFSGIKAMPMAVFKEWLEKGHTGAPIEAQTVHYAKSYVNLEGLLPVPDCRQPDDYSCGAAAAMSVGKAFGVGPETIEEWKKALGTTKAASTDPIRIAQYLRGLGLEIDVRCKMTLDELHDCWRERRPVIVPMKEYSTPSKQTSEKYGHYVVVVAVPDDLQLVLVQDPSLDNILEGEDADQVNGVMPITFGKWMEVWHDTIDGQEYDHFGIIGPPLPERADYAKHDVSGEARDDKGEWTAGNGAGTKPKKKKNESNLFARKGSVAGFTKSGESVAGQFLSKSKCWYVSVHNEEGRSQLTDERNRRFATGEEADDYANSLIDAEKTKEKKWWGANEEESTQYARDLSLSEMIDRIRRLGPNQSGGMLPYLVDFLIKNPHLREQVSLADWAYLKSMAHLVPGPHPFGRDGEQPTRYEAVHAPHNVTIQGKEYKGGEFIPGNVMAKATPEEKAQLSGGKQSKPPSSAHLGPATKQPSSDHLGPLAKTAPSPASSDHLGPPKPSTAALGPKDASGLSPLPQSPDYKRWLAKKKAMTREPAFTMPASIDDLHDQAQHIAVATHQQAESTGLWQRLGEAGEWLKSKAKTAYNAINSQFGAKQGMAIMAAAIVATKLFYSNATYWSDELTFLEGNGVVPLTALSHLYTTTRGYLGFERDDYPQLSMEEITQIGQELAEDLARDWNTKCNHVHRKTWSESQDNLGPGQDQPRHYEATHAPHNVTIQGKEFKGGEFIPADVVASATPEEKAQLGKGTEAKPKSSDHLGPPKPPSSDALGPPKAPKPTSTEKLGPPPSVYKTPGTYTHDDYLDEAMANLPRLSRTAQGTLDTSASPAKAGHMATGDADKAKELAKGNFEHLISDLYAERNRSFNSPADVMTFVDGIAQRVNRGITKPESLYRTDDSEKFPYTKVAELPVARRQFAEELYQRLSDPNADPIDTAGWADWRANLTDHFYADGCGKIGQALGAFCLMRGGLPLPKYRTRQEVFDNAQHERFSPSEGPESYTKNPAYKKYQKYFHSLFRASVLKPVRDLEKQYPPLNAVGKDTQARHMLPNGSYTPERQKLHAEMIAKATGSVPKAPPGEKTYTLMGGGPASGKGSAIKSGVIQLPHDHVHIDSDQIKGAERDKTGFPGLPEYTGLLGVDDRGAGFVHEESSDIAKAMQDAAFQNGQHTLLDGTGDNSVESVMKKLNKARAHGYKVNGEYMTCATETAVKRNWERFLKTGRLPAESMLRAVHSGVSRILPELLKRGAFDHCNLWDSDDNKDGKPVLVMSANGKDVTIHDQERWKKFLAKAEEAMPPTAEVPSYYARA